MPKSNEKVRMVVFDIDGVITAPSKWIGRYLDTSLDYHTPKNNLNIRIINKDLLQNVMQYAISHGIRIGFATFGGHEKREFLELLNTELGIRLDDEVFFWNRKNFNSRGYDIAVDEPTIRKNLALEECAKIYCLDRRQIALVDDSFGNIYAARQAGYSTFHAKTHTIPNNQYTLMFVDEINRIFDDLYSELDKEETLDYFFPSENRESLSCKDKIDYAFKKYRKLVDEFSLSDVAQKKPESLVKDLRIAMESLLSVKARLDAEIEEHDLPKDNYLTALMESLHIRQSGVYKTASICREGVSNQKSERDYSV